MPASAAPSPPPPGSRSGISCGTADRAGPTTRLNSSEVQGLEPRTQRSDKRVVRARTITQVDTPTLEEAQAGGLGARSELREQPGLADAGLAPDDDRADRPRPGAVEHGLQPSSSSPRPTNTGLEILPTSRIIFLRGGVPAVRGPA